MLCAGSADQNRLFILHNSMVLGQHPSCKIWSRSAPYAATAHATESRQNYKSACTPDVMLTINLIIVAMLRKAVIIHTY